ncbi:MAG: ABC transporter ATP-binding protein [Gammaproteobacteria bacterium]
MTLLAAKNLRVRFPGANGALEALRGVSFSVAAGERLGIVGESGAGKSLAAAALLNLPPVSGEICGGEVLFEGRDLLTLPAEELRAVRGRRIAMIFQDPMTTLNPVLSIGRQLEECLEAHGIARGDKARETAVARLREVSIPSPEERMEAYPHELSGGMRQRVVIAAALICNPSLIVADEPTTALDVTIQADIMALLARLCESRRMALVLITHDLSLVAQMTGSILVMYSGLAVERGATAEVIARPHHPYTRGLLACLRRRGGGRFYQIPGNMPPLGAIPNGCAFHPRCRYAQEICRNNPPPPEIENGAGRGAACHFTAEIAAKEKEFTADETERQSASEIAEKDADVKTASEVSATETGFATAANIAAVKTDSKTAAQKTDFQTAVKSETGGGDSKTDSNITAKDNAAAESFSAKLTDA